MEQRKINELRKRNAKIVFKAGIPFQVFDDDDLNDDQIFEMMDWFDEANEEGLLPIEVEQLSAERKRYLQTRDRYYQEYYDAHSERISAIQNAKNGEDKLALIAQIDTDACDYAEEICKQKGLK